MVEGVPILASAVYDDAALQASIGVSAESLSKARRSGDLRFARAGKRVVYLGSWVIAWLESASQREGAVNAH